MDDAAVHFLNVPFGEKDQAKSLGARWNPTKKKWFIHLYHPNLLAFKKWMPRAVASLSSTSSAPSSSTGPSFTVLESDPVPQGRNSAWSARQPRDVALGSFLFRIIICFDKNEIMDSAFKFAPDFFVKVTSTMRSIVPAHFSMVSKPL